MARVYDNYADLITFSRASRGTALRPISYGDELVSNGTFDGSDGWTGSGWTFSSGQASVTGNGTNQNLYGTPISNAVSGKIYQLTYDVISSSLVGGSFRAGAFSGASFFGNTFFELDTSIGSHKLNFVGQPTSTGSVLDFWLTSGATSGTLVIDNISVREVLFDQPNGTLTLFNHPTNIPRIEYDANGNRLGLLVEENRTNLVTYSEDFTNASWSTSDASVTKKTGIVAPDGSENVYHFQENTATTQHQLTSNVTPATQVFSVFAKGDGSGRYLKIYGYGLGGSSESPVFDVDNGIVYEPPTQTHFLSASIQDVGNGWYRCSLIADTDAGTGNPAFALVNATDSHGVVGYTGDGTSGVYLFGAQIEAGSFPTSYIPSNSGSTTTRSADVASIGVSEFGYNQDAGTLFVEYVGTKDTFAGVAALQVDASTVTDRISILQTSATTIESVVSNNSTTQSQQFQPSAVASQISKAAVAFEANRVDSSFDGSVETTDTSVVVPDEIGILRIAGYGSAYELNSHIKSIKYYPRALTATQIQELTS